MGRGLFFLTGADQAGICAARTNLPVVGSEIAVPGAGGQKATQREAGEI